MTDHRPEAAATEWHQMVLPATLRDIAETVPVWKGLAGSSKGRHVSPALRAAWKKPLTARAAWEDGKMGHALTRAAVPFGGRVLEGGCCLLLQRIDGSVSLLPSFPAGPCSGALVPPRWDGRPSATAHSRNVLTPYRQKQVPGISMAPGWEAATRASFPGGTGSALTKQPVTLPPERL